jgi:RND family efflux transporter MFP subunit
MKLNQLHLVLLATILIFSCGEKIETTEVQEESITEAVYAAGIIRSKDQCKVYSAVNGIIEEIKISEGDSVQKGDILFILRSESSRLNAENAALTKEYAQANLAGEKLAELNSTIQISRSRMQVDSANAFRQKKLWEQQIGTKSEWEQKELAYKNSLESYQSAQLKYEELKKQLSFQAEQAEKLWKLNLTQLREYEVRSERNGRVYGIYRKKGEWAGVQQELALLGDAQNFMLELQVDENDITKIKKGQRIFITMDSYKNQVFEAIVLQINPAMNEKTRTFIIEAEFIQTPPTLYPNLTAEANIVIQVKEKTLTIPRKYLVEDSFVWVNKSEKKKIQVGLKDYQKVEVLEGLKAGEVIQMPTP